MSPNSHGRKMNRFDQIAQQSAPPISEEFATARSERSRFPVDRASVASGLFSAVVHLLVLLLMALAIFVVDRRAAPLVIMSVDGGETETLELVSVDVVTLPEVTTSAPELPNVVAPVELEIGEPMLASAAIANASPNSIGGAPAAKVTGKTGSFFGTSAYGNDFVYVIDMSYSMSSPSEYGRTRFEVACGELLRSIESLTPSQSFCVFMFCYATRPMFDRPPELVPASAQNKQRFRQWLSRVRLGAGTDPRFAVSQALQLRPSAVFLLSDGEFNGRKVNLQRIPGNRTVEKIIGERSAVPIHTIAFEDLLNRRRLRRIATMTAGTHRFIGQVSGQDIVMADLMSNELDDQLYAMQCLIDGSHTIFQPAALRAAIPQLVDALAHTRLRQAAHGGLVVLSDGQDHGPFGEAPSAAEYRQAASRWREYWETRLR